MSLSNPKVIETLNRYFVPVYLSNADYRPGGSAPPEETAELRRIHREGHAAKLSVGSVHAYILNPDGGLVQSMHVAEAYKAQNLLPALEAAVRQFSIQAGSPVARPKPQSAAAAQPGELPLHVVARYLERKGDSYVLTRSSGGDWTAFPGEDWIRLTPQQIGKLLPPPAVKPGDAWEVDRELTAEIVTRFYPPTENNDLRKNRIDSQSLRATVTSANKGVVTARLEGAFKMQHSFYHKDDGRFVEGKLIGVLEVEPSSRKVRSLKLVTDEAVYRGPGAGQPFG